MEDNNEDERAQQEAEEEKEVVFRQPESLLRWSSTSRSVDTTFMATPYSQYQPDDTFYVDESPRHKLNVYLESRDASPIRHSLSTPWHEASERTKRHYLNKGWRVITTCLEELTPGQSERVLDSLAKSKFKVVDDSLDHTLLEALCECYKNANQWSTRRQVLSIMADKVSFSELKKWIPDISRYRFNIARHHQLLHASLATKRQEYQNVCYTREIGTLLAIHY